MTIKNLITVAIVHLLMLALPVSAGVILQNSGSGCQSKGVACNSISTAVIPASEKPVSSEMQDNCSAKINKKLTVTPWSKALADLNDGQSLANGFEVFQASDLAVLSPAKDNLNYDIISDADIQDCNIDEVPIPSAGWLFASALLGFITFSNRHRA